MLYVLWSSYIFKADSLFMDMFVGSSEVPQLGTCHYICHDWPVNFPGFLEVHSLQTSLPPYHSCSPLGQESESLYSCSLL